ncbi:MAG: hypothetical protein GY719_26450 [bacterium]|nr:hypothetical protein [bacterium]
MTRYDITEWSDFVREVTDPETEEQMREHLAVASVRVQRVVATLRRVAEVGLMDARDAVPEHAVRIAKAIASVPRVTPHERDSEGASVLRRLLCTVAFDSRLQPASAGTRDLEGSHRQMVYEAEGYRIDVRMEQELESQGTVAVGQVSRHDEGARPLARVPVLVFSGMDEIGHTVTSRFGEFQFEGLPRRDLDLCLVVGEDFLEIPLAAESGNEPGLAS